MVKMRLAAILMIGIAIVIAFFVAFLTYNRLQKAPVKQAKSVETMPIAVAKYDLSWGARVDKSMIKMASFLKESLPPGCFSDVSALEGRTLLRPVKLNEPIYESMLAPTTVQGGGVAAIVTPKKRAMSVSVDKVIGIAGFIHAGNRVDVLATVAQSGRNSETITKIILENILVLAAGSDLDTGNKQEKPVSADVITLEVTPEEGEKLALATTQGKIVLALRNYVDDEDVGTKGVTISTLISSYGTRPGKAENISEKLPYASVTLIKGTTVTELTF